MAELCIHHTISIDNLLDSIDVRDLPDNDLNDSYGLSEVICTRTYSTECTKEWNKTIEASYSARHAQERYLDTYRNYTGENSLEEK